MRVQIEQLEGEQKGKQGERRRKKRGEGQERKEQRLELLKDRFKHGPDAVLLGLISLINVKLKLLLTFKFQELPEWAGFIVTVG